MCFRRQKCLLLFVCGLPLKIRAVRRMRNQFRRAAVWLIDFNVIRHVNVPCSYVVTHTASRIGVGTKPFAVTDAENIQSASLKMMIIFETTVILPEKNRRPVKHLSLSPSLPVLMLPASAAFRLSLTCRALGRPLNHVHVRRKLRGGKDDAVSWMTAASPQAEAAAGWSALLQRHRCNNGMR